MSEPKRHCEKCTLINDECVEDYVARNRDYFERFLGVAKPEEIKRWNPITVFG